jgi:hypothetical protein
LGIIYNSQATNRSAGGERGLSQGVLPAFYGRLKVANDFQRHGYALFRAIRFRVNGLHRVCSILLLQTGILLQVAICVQPNLFWLFILRLGVFSKEMISFSFFQGGIYDGITSLFGEKQIEA